MAGLKLFVDKERWFLYSIPTMKLNPKLLKAFAEASAHAGYLEHRQAVIDAVCEVAKKLDDTWTERKEKNFIKMANEIHDGKSR